MRQARQDAHVQYMRRWLVEAWGALRNAGGAQLKSVHRSEMVTHVQTRIGGTLEPGACESSEGSQNCERVLCSWEAMLQHISERVN